MSVTSPQVSESENATLVPDCVPPSARRRIRRVLAAGFGGVLLLMVAAGYAAVRVLHDIHAESEQLRSDSLARVSSLTAVRSKLFLSHAYLRDYLLDPDDSRAPQHLQDFQKTWLALQHDLDAYPAPLDSTEASLLGSLRERIRNHWDSIEPSLAWPAERRRVAGLAFYNSTVLPSRVLALEFTAEIDQIHSRQANNTEAGIARAFEGLRRHLLIMLLVTLAAATILAIGSAAYILRLERETRLGYEQVSAGRSDLERLSRRLVAAQEEERKSISRELHDQVAQTLNALLVDVGNLQKRITGDALSQEYLRAIRDLANSSVNSIRDIALLLRPSMLDDLGLTAALDWQAREASRRTGLKVKVSAEGVTDDLPDSIRTCVYRVVQEALQNAARHAQAKTVQIELKQSDCSLIVMVRDDGLGFQPLSSRGLGILGMQERVREAWGILRIDSAPGGGTTVFAEMPTRPTAQARDS